MLKRLSSCCKRPLPVAWLPADVPGWVRLWVPAVPGPVDCPEMNWQD
ncbi:MAG: hypothetical protein ACYS83_06960 [Planctomycetota bacterium]